MRCAEFEARLNDVLDERVEPAADAVLAEHAERCPRCAELAASHELLLEGARLMPKVELRSAERTTLARHVVAAMANGDQSFRNGTVELADREPLAVGANRRASLAMIGLAVAAAAAVLITVLPRLGDGNVPHPNIKPDVKDRAQNEPQLPNGPKIEAPLVGPSTDPRQELEGIAWVGYQLADGLKPVTSSMVEKVREWRKRPPIFHSDENLRSSQYLLEESAIGLS
jgi:hypothetical protein